MERTARNIAIVNALEQYVNDNNTGGDPLIFFSGEFDSNQTTFENDSNNLKIGVIARNLHTAQVLLRLVRIIIDNNYDLFDDPFEQNDDDLLTFEKYVKRFREGSDYIVSFPLTSAFVSELMSANGSYQVVSTIDVVDVWTIPRIFPSIRRKID